MNYFTKKPLSNWAVFLWSSEFIPLFVVGLLDQQQAFPVDEACQPCTDMPIWGTPTGSKHFDL